MRVAILTSPNQWFLPYAKILTKKIEGSELFNDHRHIGSDFEIVFILGYHQIIGEHYLEIHKHNLVVHESNLPKGKGWSPMFWQILEGKSEIPFTLFEASNGVDDGNIYMQKTLELTGYELHDELRNKQAYFNMGMCADFIENYTKYQPIKQKGKETFYKKRTSKDSELDINRSIKDQFNLLRIVSNDHYPAFFEIGGKKYTLKVDEVENETR